VAETIVDKITWENFHRVVNMSSRELQSWLAVEGAGETTESLPEHAGPPLGHRVLDILGKRRADLTDDDVAVMRRVVDKVVAKRGEELDAVVDDDRERRRLMDLGHDPLKP
jgi:hypothetical protein